jgi:hypothetical protein
MLLLLQQHSRPSRSENVSTLKRGCGDCQVLEDKRGQREGRSRTSETMRLQLAEKSVYCTSRMDVIMRKRHLPMLLVFVLYMGSKRKTSVVRGLLVTEAPSTTASTTGQV